MTYKSDTSSGASFAATPPVEHLRVRRDKALRILAHGYAMTVDRLAGMGVPNEDLGHHWHAWLGAAVTAGLPEVAWQEQVLDRETWAQLPRDQR